MQRIFSLTAAFSLCFTLSGCGNNLKPLSLFVNDKELISLTMSKEEIEQIIEPYDFFNETFHSDETDEKYSKYYEKGGIEVYYKDDIPYKISISDDEKKYRDCFGLKPGMDFKEAEEKIENEYMTNISKTVYFDKKGKKIKLSKIERDEYSSIYYLVDSSDNKIMSIDIELR